MSSLAPPKVQALPQYIITDADKKRQQCIADAWQAYHGALDPPLAKMPGQPDDNVMSNRMRPIVDGGVSFLFGKEVAISVDEGAPAEAQTFLDDTWGANEKRLPLLQSLATSGAIAGRAFLRIVPSKNGKRFRLVVVDPSTVFVKTAPQDVETVLLYCIEFCETETVNGSPQQVYYREEMRLIDPDGDPAENGDNNMADSDATWEIQHWTRIGEKGQWVTAGDPIIWPYPFPPLFSCPNLPLPHEFWTLPDITPDLIGVNAALNLVQSNINRVGKLYGAPILYATGTGEQSIDIKPGKIIGLPTSESKIAAVTISSDMANALAFAHDLRSDIDEQAAWPGVATGRLADMPRGNVSGIAIELLFMPALKKTDKKRCTYGALIIDVSKALLQLNHMSEDIGITLDWQNPLPHDDLPAVQAALVKKNIGISDATLQRELGYDPDEEMELSQTEDAQKLQNFMNGQGMPPEPAQPLGGPPAQPGAQPPASPFIGRGE